MFVFRICVFLISIVCITAARQDGQTTVDSLVNPLIKLECGSHGFFLSIDHHAAFQLAFSNPSLEANSFVHKVYAGRRADNQTCQAVKSDGFHWLIVPFADCNTDSTEGEEEIVFKNQITIVVRTKIGSMFDDTMFRRPTVCRMLLTHNLSWHTTESPSLVSELHQDFNSTTNSTVTTSTVDQSYQITNHSTSVIAVTPTVVDLVLNSTTSVDTPNQPSDSTLAVNNSTITDTPEQILNSNSISETTTEVDILDLSSNSTGYAAPLSSTSTSNDATLAVLGQNSTTQQQADEETPDPEVADMTHY